MSEVCVVKRDIAGRAEDEHPLNRDRKFGDVSEQPLKRTRKRRETPLNRARNIKAFEQGSE